MSPEDKFRFRKPSKQELADLGQLVDELEDLITTRQPFDDKLAALNERLTVPATPEGIVSYYGSTTRDEFVRGHLTPDPHRFRDLTDSDMLWLIGQTLEPIPDSEMFYYARILEISAGVTQGTLFDLPSFQDMGEPEDILRELRGSRRVFHL